MSIADDLYSILSLGAIAAAVAGCAMVAYALWQRSKEITVASILATLSLALVLDVVAVAVHWTYGHPATGEQSMNLGQFLIAHPSLWIVLVLCGAASVAIFVFRE